MGSMLRLSAWGLVLALTAGILAYPVDLRLVDAPIQSTAIIDSLPLFAALYYLWLLTLLALLFSSAGRAVDHREKIALVALFAIVFWGFWTINTPDGQSEEPAFLAYNRYLSDTGHINLDIQNFTYFDFPGLSLFGHSVSSIAGVADLDARTLIMLSNAALMSLLLYCVYKRLADSSANPSTMYLLATPLVIQSNMMLSVGFFFRPENALGLLLLMALVVLLMANREERTFFGRWQYSLIAIVLFAALTITHFMTSLIFVAILGGVYLVRMASGRRMATASTIALFLVMTSAWLLYYAVRIFGNITSTIPYTVDLVQEGDIFFYAFTLGAANAGGDVPLWATAVRLFWMVAIYGLAGLLAVWNLARLRSLGSGERLLTGALLSVGVATVTVAVVNGSGDQLARFVQYGAFFAVPVVLAFIIRVVPGRLGLALVAVPLLLLSLPTFLAYHSQIAVSSFYPAEHRAGEFLRSQYEDDDDLVVFSGIRDRHLYLYYLPTANFSSSTFGTLGAGDQEIIWEDTGAVVCSFIEHDFGGPQTNGVFVFSQGFRGTYQHLYGISPDDANWRPLEAQLAATSMVYDGGQLQIFLNQTREEQTEGRC